MAAAAAAPQAAGLLPRARNAVLCRSTHASYTSPAGLFGGADRLFEPCKLSIVGSSLRATGRTTCVALTVEQVIRESVNSFTLCANREGTTIFLLLFTAETLMENLLGRASAIATRKPCVWRRGELIAMELLRRVEVEGGRAAPSTEVPDGLTAGMLQVGLQSHSVCHPSPSSMPLGKDKAWPQMSIEEKAAAARLGYDQPSWEAGEWPEACTKQWSELNADELGAAQVLGYVETEWDAELSADAVADIVAWTEMSELERVAASRLGYEEKSWNSAEVPDICSRAWINLSASELAAAGLLGYTEALWDSELTAMRSAQAAFLAGKERAWPEMTDKEKAAAARLGYDEPSWEAGEWPECCTRQWSQLNADELGAALELGYAQEDWDGELASKAQEERERAERWVAAPSQRAVFSRRSLVAPTLLPPADMPVRPNDDSKIVDAVGVGLLLTSMPLAAKRAFGCTCYTLRGLAHIQLRAPVLAVAPADATWPNAAFVGRLPGLATLHVEADPSIPANAAVLRVAELRAQYRLRMGCMSPQAALFVGAIIAPGKHVLVGGGSHTLIKGGQHTLRLTNPQWTMELANIRDRVSRPWCPMNEGDAFDLPPSLTAADFAGLLGAISYAQPCWLEDESDWQLRNFCLWPLGPADQWLHDAMRLAVPEVCGLNWCVRKWTDAFLEGLAPRVA